MKKQPPALPAPRDKAARLVGKTISDRYRIDAILAAGGMGTVYRGEHVHMQKRVAIKVLLPGIEGFPEQVARFEREAVAGAHVDHVNVASATDFGRLRKGSYFLILELVEGITLHELIERGPVPAPRAVHLAKQIAAGLDACHRMGVIHRDLKPRNVMLDEARSDLIKIIDFGLARVPMQRKEPARTDPDVDLNSAGEVDVDVDAEVEDDGETRRQITLRGIVFGTVAYMAPETAQGMQAVDERSDLYALGVILYEMLAGKHLFDAADPAELFLLQRTTEPPPLAERAPGVEVPPAIEAVVRRLLEKKPSDRYATAADVVEALDRAMLSSGPDLLPSAAAGATPVVGAQSASIRALAATVTPRPEDPPTAPPVAAELAADATHTSLSASRVDFRKGLRPSPRAAVVIALGVVVAAAVSLGRLAPTPTLLQADTSAGVAGVTAGRAARTSLAEIEAQAWRQRFLMASDAKDNRGLTVALLELAERDPGAFADREFIGPLPALATRLAFEEDPRHKELFLALADKLGPPGIDVLYEIASSRGGSKGAKRANEMLRRPEVRDRASPALRVALDLRDGRCDAKASVFDRAAREGDVRALRLLERLRSPESCTGGSGQCCFFGHAGLDKAIRAILARI